MKMRTAILVIDMINEYAHERGRIFCTTAPAIAGNLNHLIRYGRQNGWSVIFVNTALTPEDAGSLIVRKWGMQAERGTWNSAVIGSIDKQDHDIVIPKTAFDGFFMTGLEQVLRDLGIRRVVVTGIHTHVCVFFTAMSAAERGFEVVALGDCMTTGFEENHRSRLRMYQTHIGTLSNLEEFLAMEN